MQALIDSQSVLSATGRPAWKALTAHYQKIRKRHLRDMFAADPKLAQRLTAEAVGIYLDYSTNRVTPITQAVIWQIDPFDHWGVEFGKVLVQRIIPELESDVEPTLGHDSSTDALIRRYRKLKEPL